MKNLNLFLLSMLAAGVLTYSQQGVTAKDKTREQATTKMTTVVANDCEITGSIVHKKDGVYAVFHGANTTGHDRKFKLHFAADCTDPGSMYSRMGPRPVRIKADAIDVVVAANKTWDKEILLRWQALPPEKATVKSDETEAQSKAVAALANDRWTLTVSAKKIDKASPFGAVGAVATTERIALSDGATLLASASLPTPARALRGAPSLTAESVDVEIVL